MGNFKQMYLQGAVAAVPAVPEVQAAAPAVTKPAAATPAAKPAAAVAAAANAADVECDEVLNAFFGKAA